MQQRVFLLNQGLLPNRKCADVQIYLQGFGDKMKTILIGIFVVQE